MDVFNSWRDAATVFFLWRWQAVRMWCAYWAKREFAASYNMDSRILLRLDKAQAERYSRWIVRNRQAVHDRDGAVPIPRR